jgi:hypothetical protein
VRVAHLNGVRLNALWYYMQLTAWDLGIGSCRFSIL